MSLIDVVVGAVVGGCIGIAGGVIAVKYEWRKQADFVCIKEVYEPLYNEIIKYHDSITKFELSFPRNIEIFVRGIKNNYWYSRVRKNISEKFEEWQSRASEYNSIRWETHEKLKKVIDQEVDKRAAALEPSPDNGKVVSEFKRQMKQGYSEPDPFYLLMLGEIKDENYHIIGNFIRMWPPLEREIAVKLASDFPKAIYEEFRKDPLFTNLHDKVKEIECATARLREVLEKHIKK